MDHNHEGEDGIDDMMAGVQIEPVMISWSPVVIEPICAPLWSNQYHHDRSNVRCYHHDWYNLHPYDPCPMPSWSISYLLQPFAIDHDGLSIYTTLCSTGIHHSCPLPEWTPINVPFSPWSSICTNMIDSIYSCYHDRSNLYLVPPLAFTCDRLLSTDVPSSSPSPDEHLLFYHGVMNAQLIFIRILMDTYPYPHSCNG